MTNSAVGSIRKTPLVLQGIFLELMRQYFKVSSSPQFRWSSDVRETQLIIEPIHKLNFDEVQARPAIYVARGPYQYPAGSGRLAFNDQSFADLRTSSLGQTILVSCTVQVIPLDKRAAAVERLAEEISEGLLVFKSAIRKDYSFLRFDVAGIAPLGVAQESREYFTAPVTVSTQWSEEWFVDQLAPKLQHIRLQVYNSVTEEVNRCCGEGSYDRPYAGVPAYSTPCTSEAKFIQLPPEPLCGSETAEPGPEHVDPEGYGEGFYGG